MLEVTSSQLTHKGTGFTEKFVSSGGTGSVKGRKVIECAMLAGATEGDRRKSSRLRLRDRLIVLRIHAVGGAQ